MKAVAQRWIFGLVSLVWVFAQVAAQTPAAQAPAAQAPAAAASFTKEQLEQIVAPMALYPDPLVSQMLMASTYPLEIVEAARWLKTNPGLKDKALEEGLKTQDWDASVKSLCGFPDVIKQMDENLDWTQDLGDAFLAQKTELMDTLQRMRGKAYDAGQLKTTEQQVVTQQPDKIIVIQPADPEVIYVPTYSPTVVYGGWSYPSYYYPPMYYPPPYGYGAMAFTVGVVWGAAIWGGCNWGWGGSDVDIDINRQNNFNRNTNIDGGRNQASNRAGGKQSWQHDASHRGGVNYRDNKTAQQYGASAGSNRVSRDQARGYDRGGGAICPQASVAPVRRPARPEAAISEPRRATPALRLATWELHPATQVLHPATVGLRLATRVLRPATVALLPAAAAAPTAARATRASTDLRAAAAAQVAAAA